MSSQKKPSEDKKIIHIYKDVHRKFKIHCAIQNKSIISEANKALLNHMEREKTQKK